MVATETTYLNDLGLDTGDFSILENASEFALSGRSVTLQREKTIPFNATINGNVFEATATMHEAALTRITEQTHVVKSKDNKQTKIISGVIRPVHMDVSIDFGEYGVKTLADVLYDLVNLQMSKEGKEPISKDLFAQTTARMGLPIVPMPDRGIDGNMQLFWQHFGAEQDEINRIFDLFSSLGAKSAMPQQPGRIQRVLQMPGKGVPVTSIEIGRQDRSATQHANRVIKLDDGSTQTIDGVGFIDFVDAVLSSFSRGVSQRKIRSILKVKLEELSKASKPKEDDIAIVKAQIDTATKLSRDWIGTWSGGQRRILVQPDGTAVYQDIIDPVNASSGRLTLELPNDVEEEFNFWSNQNAGVGAAPAVVDTVGGDVNDDEPF